MDFYNNFKIYKFCYTYIQKKGIILFYKKALYDIFFIIQKSINYLHL